MKTASGAAETNGMAQPRRYVCACFLRRNYFVKSLNLHVEYTCREEFIPQYKQLLADRGCDNDDKLEEVVFQIEKEKQRRRDNGKLSVERREAIRKLYEPLHPNLYKLQESFLHPAFLEIVAYSKKPCATPDGLQEMMSVFGSRLYSFPVFTEKFCEEFIEELVHFEKCDLPKGRPNSMNNYGILLNELGFDEGLIAPLRVNYLKDICRLLYPDWGGGNLDSQRAFTVTYRMAQDKNLDYHFDDSEITLNVCLGKHFEEGALYFGNMRTDTGPPKYSGYEHVVTHGVLHRGQHLHGAMPITDGERYNLIIWMRSSGIRNCLCPMCGQIPQLIETEGDGSGFTAETVNVCTVT